MTIQIARAGPQQGPVRKRRVHTKSRAGCGNCKIRRVKCDEARPCCSKCQAYGVSCSYNGTSSDLQRFGESAFLVNPLLSTTLSVNRTVLAALNEHCRNQSGPTAYQLSNHDLGLLSRFYERTGLTIGQGSTRYIYRKEGLKLALRHSFLIHIVLTLTMMHDRQDLPASHQTTTELHHWYEGTSQFNRTLSGPLTSSERDAVWVAAVLLGCSTLAHVDGDSPEQAWPLKSPSPTDLDWLKMSWGKKEAWRIADIYRPDSSLRELQCSHVPDDFLSVPSDEEVFINLPQGLRMFCGLGPNSTPATNPCHVPGSILGRLLSIENNWENMLRFLAFLGHMPVDFRTLLEAKDPRALVIMLWYQTLWLGSEQWWMRKRCVLETEATIIYLERYHGDIPHLQEMLEFPKAVRMSTKSNQSHGKGHRLDSVALPTARSFVSSYSS